MDFWVKWLLNRFFSLETLPHLFPFEIFENRIPEARIGDFSTLPPQRSEEAQGRKMSSARRDLIFKDLLFAVSKMENGDSSLFFHEK
jgi:hypothetical protein